MAYTAGELTAFLNNHCPFYTEENGTNGCYCNYFNRHGCRHPKHPNNKTAAQLDAEWDRKAEARLDMMDETPLGQQLEGD